MYILAHILFELVLPMIYMIIREDISIPNKYRML